MRKLLLIGTTVLLTVTSASAQATERYQADIYATVGCDWNRDMNCHTIWLSGDVGKGDASRFEQVLWQNNVRKAIVILDSPGGLLNEGLAIGTTIWQRGYTTKVRAQDWCLSVCALIWLAGSVHYLESGAHVGFHGAYQQLTDTNGAPLNSSKPVLSNSGNAKVGAYLGGLGFSYDAIAQMVAAGPDSMLWLSNQDQANKLGISITTVAVR